MILNQKAKRVEQDADLAFQNGDEAEAERLDSELMELWRENERRLNAAKARFESFDEEARDSGWQNASESAANDSQTVWFSDLGAEVLQMCEFWELAADSAQSIVDFRD